MDRRVLICGGRNYSNTKRMREEIMRLQEEGYHCVVEGGAAGADTLAREAALYFGLDVITYWPNWERYGLAAGGIRNQKMLDEGMPLLVVSFPGGPGTADMVSRARMAHVEVREIND